MGIVLERLDWDRNALGEIRGRYHTLLYTYLGDVNIPVAGGMGVSKI